MSQATLPQLNTEIAPAAGELEKIVRESFSFVPNSVMSDGSAALMVKTETQTGNNFSARVDPNYVCNLPAAEKDRIRNYVRDILARSDRTVFFEVVRGIGEKHPYVENGRWLIQKDYPHLPLALMKNLCDPDPKKSPRYTW